MQPCVPVWAPLVAQLSQWQEVRLVSPLKLPPLDTLQGVKSIRANRRRQHLQLSQPKSGPLNLLHCSALRQRQHAHTIVICTVSGVLLPCLCSKQR